MSNHLYLRRNFLKWSWEMVFLCCSGWRELFKVIRICTMHYAGNLVDRRKCWILQIRGGLLWEEVHDMGWFVPLPGDLPPILHLLIIPHLYTSYHTCTHFSALVYVIPHLYTLYFTCTHHTILACTMPHLLCAHNAPLLCSSFQRTANQLRTRTSDTWQMHSRFPLHSVFTLSSKA